jgi:hypothetical protein
MSVWTIAIPLLLLAALAGAVAIEVRRKHMTGWLPGWARQDWREPVDPTTTRHLMFCFVDHFEPGWKKPTLEVERERVRRWRDEYPRLCEGHRDADGCGPVHTFFFPEEEYRPEHIESLVELCRMGIGEIEIHLHHDNDTDHNLRRTLSRFTRLLVDRHDALPVDPVTGQPRWAFIHGNWALDNSRPDGRWCGVNNEITVLKEEGCYADFTFPSAPDPSQPRTVNRIYYAIDDPNKPNSHQNGSRVEAGRTQPGDLMIVQGPLGLQWHNRKFGLLPRIENADIRASNPPSRERIDAWVDTAVQVAGRPEWIFVKVHTHGAQEPDMEALLGGPMKDAFDYLESKYNDGVRWKLHYVSARETYNIVKAAEAGLTGNPGEYRDFSIPRPSYGEARQTGTNA